MLLTSSPARLQEPRSMLWLPPSPLQVSGMTIPVTVNCCPSELRSASLTGSVFISVKQFATSSELRPGVHNCLAWLPNARRPVTLTSLPLHAASDAFTSAGVRGPLGRIATHPVASMQADISRKTFIPISEVSHHEAERAMSAFHPKRPWPAKTCSRCGQDLTTS